MSWRSGGARNSFRSPSYGMQTIDDSPEKLQDCCRPLERSGASTSLLEVLSSDGTEVGVAFGNGTPFLCTSRMKRPWHPG